jgi:signal transduction histidine kinase
MKFLSLLKECYHYSILMKRDVLYDSPPKQGAFSMLNGELSQRPIRSEWEHVAGYIQNAVKWFQGNTSIPSWFPPRFRTYRMVYLFAVGLQSLALILQLMLVAFVPGYNFPALLFTLSLILIALELGAGPALIVACSGFILLDILLNPSWLSPATRLGDSVGFLVQFGIILAMTLLASQAGKARRVAETARQQQEAFLHIASHELRTPLTSLTLRAQFIERLVQQSADEMLDPRLREVAMSQRQYLAQLNRLIGDMLDASRIESGKLSLRLARCDLAQAIQEVVTDYQHLYPQRRIHLERDEHPIWGMVDQDRVSQVVVNLLVNAIRYSPKKQPIEVVIQQSGAEAILCVTDHGPGIAPAELEKIWDRSYQILTHAQSTREGLGLGLFISRTIVELHQGRIAVQSQLGVGTTFQVVLPLTPSSIP